jgi:hypothetical protein
MTPNRLTYFWTLTKKLYVLSAFSKKKLIFTKRTILSLFGNKGQNRVFGQF